jgi:hypothetical protein
LVSHNPAFELEKILKLRDVAKRFLKFEVGNGENIQMWLDSWHPSGILLETFGQRVVMMHIALWRPCFPLLFSMEISSRPQLGLTLW